ncbi:transposase, partial [Enterococcus faecium]
TIRRTIYSTNLIEGFNKQLKRYTRRKEQFPNEESLERFLVSQFNHKICQIKRDKTFHLRNSKKLLMVFG